MKFIYKRYIRWPSSLIVGLLIHVTVRTFAIPCKCPLQGKLFYGVQNANRTAETIWWVSGHTFYLYSILIAISLYDSCNNRDFAEHAGFQDSVQFFETLETQGVSRKVIQSCTRYCGLRPQKFTHCAFSQYFESHRTREHFMIQHVACLCSKHQVIFVAVCPCESYFIFLKLVIDLETMYEHRIA